MVLQVIAEKVNPSRTVETLWQRAEGTLTTLRFPMARALGMAQVTWLDNIGPTVMLSVSYQ